MDYHLVAISCEIYENDFNEGEGAYTGCGYNNEPIGRTFSNFPAMLKYLADAYGLSANDADYDREPGRLLTAKQVANHSEAQNGGWFEPTDAEIDAWRAGRYKLYTEHYDIRFHAVA